ncbi:MAG: PcfJ domain-containing protein [Clostridia bacterium]|nr:PcfJ domain-containing protein [Clostridia bacterium]
MDFYEKARIAASELPTLPPEETAEVLEQRGLLGGNVLVYRVAYVYNPLTEKKEKMVKVTCTACGESYYLEYSQEITYCRWNPCTFGFYSPMDRKVIVSGDSCICNECGEGLRAIHIGGCKSFGSYTVISSCGCTTVHNDGGFLSVLTWRVYRCADKEGQIKYYADKNEGIMIVDNKPVRVTGHRKNMGGYDSQLPRWEALKKFTIQIADSPTEKIIPFSADIVNNSSSDKCGLKEFIDGNSKNCSISIFGYLKLWCKYPNVENLVKSGMAHFVNSLIVECFKHTTSYYYDYTTFSFDVRKTEKYINWKQSRPHLMLGIAKDKLFLIRELSVNEFFLYKYAKNNDRDELMLAELKQGSDSGKRDKVEFFGAYLKKVKPHYKRTLDYISRQKKRYKQKDLINLQYLRDYWEALHNVYGEYPKELLYPKDLKLSHDRSLLLVKEAESEKLNNQIKARAEKLKPLVFKDEKLGLMITPAASHGELIKEGKLLDHCVARYANDIAKGTTAIFFIRKVSEPDIPFFTLELKDGRVVQNRGYKNCDRTKDVVVFEKEWLEFIRKGAVING